jgi:uncharacterized protein (TIGR03435 family)
MRKLFFATLLTTVVACAQQPAPPVSAFEVASIRPAKVTDGCFSMLPPGGSQYALTCVTLRNLIGLAYKTERIEGGGPALDSFYDLRATVPGDKLWTTESVAPLMKQLLSERFHLVVHQGKRELPGYALVLAKSGAKLAVTEPDRAAEGQKAGESSANFIAPGAVKGSSVNSGGIASLLSMAVHAPVTDHTNLTGLYNFALRYSRGSEPNSSFTPESDSRLPTFFTAIEEQLGLKLQPQKVMVETFVVDHVDSEPTEN